VATQDNGFFVIQPGSTVATSINRWELLILYSYCIAILSFREESVPKHCGIVTVMGEQFKCDPIPLKTTRQVIVDELVLEDHQARKLPRTTVRQKNMEVRCE